MKKKEGKFNGLEIPILGFGVGHLCSSLLILRRTRLYRESRKCSIQGTRPNYTPSFRFVKMWIILFRYITKTRTRYKNRVAAFINKICILYALLHLQKI